MAGMPALTLWQPWASLIAAGAKPFEFRKWAAPRRLQGLRIAIHAGARSVKPNELTELLYKLESKDWRETGLVRDVALPLIRQWQYEPKALPLRSILCTAILGRPMKGKEMAQRLDLPGINDSDRFEHSLWGWPLTDVRVLTPFVPANGAQGFWTWSGTP